MEGYCPEMAKEAVSFERGSARCQESLDIWKSLFVQELKIGDNPTLTSFSVALM